MMRLTSLQKFNRWAVICFFLLLFASNAGIASNSNRSEVIPSVELPEPTGKYGIGTTVLHLTDKSRLEERTAVPDDLREIMVQVWYPADKNAQGSTVPYMDDQTSAFLLQNAPDGMPNIFEKIKTYAIVSAPPAGDAGAFPLLIFSPGHALFYSLYQALLEDIVSHGYVVAAINHPYISGITVFPDGRVVLGMDNFAPGAIPPQRVVEDDIKFLVDELEFVQVGNSKLIPDSDRIGFLGHSLGGSASIEVFLQLPQGKCAIDIDGLLFGQSHQQPIDKPIFLILNQLYSVWNVPSFAAMWKNIEQKGYLMRLDGASHLTFCDIGLLLSQAFGPTYLEICEDLGIDVGSIEPLRAMQITREYIVAFFDSCLYNNSVMPIDMTGYPEAKLKQSNPADLYEGHWRSTGYGFVLRIENNNFKLYEITNVGLVLSSRGQVHNDYLYSENNKLVAELSMRDSSLVMLPVSGTKMMFEPAEDNQLPMILDQTADPEQNFEVFWQTFEENSALFNLTKVDWKALYEKFRPQVTANTTDDELFSILSALVAPLNDGHTSIVDPLTERSFVSGPIPNTMWTENLPARLDMIASFMDDDVLNSEANGLIRYGVINGSVGYLNVLAFKGYEDPMSARSEEGGKGEEFIFGLYIDAVMVKFQNLNALIIDCRFNPGGYNELALALAGRFTDHPRLAFSKRVRLGAYDEYSAPMQLQVEPGGKTFLNAPVIVLTSDATMGAAEVFVMAIKQLHNVTLIGQKTYGAFSNKLSRTLPNGWAFTLSNERYCSWQGIDYEQQGISPHIEIGFTQVSTMRGTGKDQIIERSLKHLGCLE